MDHLHVKGKAKRGVKFRRLGVSTSAENLVTILIDIFGDRYDFNALHMLVRILNKDPSFEDPTAKYKTG